MTLAFLATVILRNKSQAESMLWGKRMTDMTNIFTNVNFEVCMEYPCGNPANKWIYKSGDEQKIGVELRMENHSHKGDSFKYLFRIYYAYTGLDNCWL